MEKTIDSHLHYGCIANLNMPFSSILNHMESRGVTHGILSSVENGEYFGENFVYLSSKGQLESNQELLNLITPYDNLLMQFWIKPLTENLTNEIGDFIVNNPKKITAMKIHPFMSRMPVTDKRMIAYIDFADSIGLPIVVHTAIGYECECKYLFEIAKKFPKTKFLAVHMDLGSDHREAAKLIARCNNLYGDTTWVSYHDFLNIKDKIGHKILFGSDVPINPETGYQFYEKYFNNKHQLSDIFERNINEFFNLSW